MDWWIFLRDKRHIRLITANKHTELWENAFTTKTCGFEFRSDHIPTPTSKWLQRLFGSGLRPNPVKRSVRTRETIFSYPSMSTARFPLCWGDVALSVQPRLVDQSSHPAQHAASPHSHPHTSQLVPFTENQWPAADGQGDGTPCCARSPTWSQLAHLQPLMEGNQDYQGLISDQVLTKLSRQDDVSVTVIC